MPESGPRGAVDEHLKERAMDEAPVGIVISDPEREDNPLVYVNDTFERITGYDEAAILGRNCRFLQGPDSDPEAVGKMREAIDAAEPVTVEVVNYRPDGTSFWNEVTIAPVRDETGSVTHFVGFQDDVTDRKEAEIALERRTEALEHLIARIDGLVYDVTEELMRAVTRAETEQRICDRLAEATPYDGTWIGELDPVTESVEPTSWAGDVEVPDAIDLDADGGGALASALSSGSVRFVDAVDALGASDAQAVASVVPLVYGDRRYGVLVVLARDRGAFDEPEPAVLRTLGRTISTAINAAETRRTIAAENVVTVEVAIRDPTLLALDLAATVAGRVRYCGTVELDDGDRSLFFDVTGDIDAIDDWANDRTDVQRATIVSSAGSGAILEVRPRPEAIVAELADRGARLVRLDATAAEADLAFEMSPELDVRSVVEWLRGQYDVVDLVGLTERRRPPRTRRGFLAELEDRLTDRQHLALRSAYVSGYYDAERATTGDELAAAMDVTRSTFHQHLRAAERKVFEAVLGPDATTSVGSA
ncbi:MAG: bacterio-opsin activator domain-containing protein [Halobacteriales archaeon]